MARWTPEQMAYVNSPRKLIEMAEWVLTSRRAGPAQRDVLKLAGLSYTRNPHELMVQYVNDCIWWAKNGGETPSNTLACKLIDEYIAHQQAGR